MQAIKAIHAILRPMEILTRASPKRPSTSPTAGADAATAAGAAGGAAASPASGRPAGGRGGEASRGGGEGVPGATPAGEAPEAGRQVGSAWGGSSRGVQTLSAAGCVLMFLCVDVLAQWLCLQPPHHHASATSCFPGTPGCRGSAREPGQG